MKTTLKEYRVTWEIDIDAESEYDAARKAAEAQRFENTTANTFVVKLLSGRGTRAPRVVDLQYRCRQCGALCAAAELVNHQMGHVPEGRPPLEEGASANFFEELY